MRCEGWAGIAREKMVQLIRDDLSHIRVEFDNWFSEGSLYRSGEYESAINALRQGDYILEREGAQWFTSTALGEDKDNVLVRSTGAPTYFASDIAYHHNKFLQRGYDQVINIWGADHQGHVPRMKAAVAALWHRPQSAHDYDFTDGDPQTWRAGGQGVQARRRVHHPAGAGG